MKWRNTTRGGKPVRIYAEDGEADWPIHGAIKTDQGWEVRVWRSDGTCYSPECDLIPATPNIDWSAQPAWCKAMMMDYAGVWHRLDGLPVLSGGLWIGGVSFRQSMHPSEYPAFDGNWQDSLCVRSEGGAK